MCGIVGKIYRERERPVESAAVAAMCATLVHRGPDDDGVYLEGNVGLAMRRLAIIDLDTGKQPIHNEDRTVWTVYNGEIYNVPELRRELEARGHHFYTRTDTEILVWIDDHSRFLLSLTAHRFDGREAERIGLVDQACESTAALEAALAQVLAGIARCSPHANAVTKSLILASRKMPREELLEQSADAFAECLRGPEGNEGVTAFLEKRKPKWMTQ